MKNTMAKENRGNRKAEILRRLIVRKIWLNKWLFRKLTIQLNQGEWQKVFLARRSRLNPEITISPKQRNVIGFKIKRWTPEEIGAKRNDCASNLSKWIRCYGKCGNKRDLHIEAQLLGISTRLYEAFLKEVPASTLEEAALGGAETFVEKSDVFGDRCKRDSPMYDASEFNLVGELISDPDLRSRAVADFNEQFTDISCHIDLVIEDGQLLMTHPRPQLTLVE